MKLRNNKGFTGVDIAISAVILMIFVSLITALFYNSSITSTKVERKAKASNIAIEVIEALKVTNFSDLVSTEENPMTIEQLNTYTSKSINIPNGYNVKILIENYRDEDIIKTITVEVSYFVGKNTENVTISTLVKNI